MWQAYSLQPVRQAQGDVPIRQAQGDVARGDLRGRRFEHDDTSSRAIALNRDVSLSLPKGIQNLVQETMLELLPTKLPKEFTLPALVHNEIEDAYDEIELLGFPVSMSDFDLLQTKYRGDVLANDLSKYLDQTIRIVGNYVTTKSVKTIRGDYMAFGTFYDEEGNFFDTTHFAQSLQKFPFAGRGVYLLEGKVVQEFNFYSLEVLKMAKLATQPDPRY
jgi:DNA polymerase-3 subunit alpha